MATSLLFALLDIKDHYHLNDLAQAQPKEPPSDASKYAKLVDKRQKKVQGELYDALYHIIEYRKLTTQLDEANMGIGEALGRVLSADLQTLDNPNTAHRIAQLRTVLKEVVHKAIDEEEKEERAEQAGSA